MPKLPLVSCTLEPQNLKASEENLACPIPRSLLPQPRLRPAPDLDKVLELASKRKAHSTSAIFIG